MFFSLNWLSELFWLWRFSISSMCVSVCVSKLLPLALTDCHEICNQCMSYKDIVAYDEGFSTPLSPPASKWQLFCGSFLQLWKHQFSWNFDSSVIFIDQAKEGFRFDLAFRISSMSVCLSIMATRLYRSSWNLESMDLVRQQSGVHKRILFPSLFWNCSNFVGLFCSYGTLSKVCCSQNY